MFGVDGAQLKDKKHVRGSACRMNPSCPVLLWSFEKTKFKVNSAFPPSPSYCSPVVWHVNSDITVTVSCWRLPDEPNSAPKICRRGERCRWEQCSRACRVVESHAINSSAFVDCLKSRSEHSLVCCLWYLSLGGFNCAWLFLYLVLFFIKYPRWSSLWRPRVNARVQRATQWRANKANAATQRSVSETAACFLTDGDARDGAGESPELPLFPISPLFPLFPLIAWLEPTATASKQLCGSHRCHLTLFWICIGCGRWNLLLRE